MLNTLSQVCYKVKSNITDSWFQLCILLLHPQRQPSRLTMSKYGSLNLEYLLNNHYVVTFTTSIWNLTWSVNICFLWKTKQINRILRWMEIYHVIMLQNQNMLITYNIATSNICTQYMCFIIKCYFKFVLLRWELRFVFLVYIVSFSKTQLYRDYPN